MNWLITDDGHRIRKDDEGAARWREGATVRETATGVGWRRVCFVGPTCVASNSRASSGERLGAGGAAGAAGVAGTAGAVGALTLNETVESVTSTRVCELQSAARRWAAAGAPGPSRRVSVGGGRTAHRQTARCWPSQQPWPLPPQASSHGWQSSPLPARSPRRSVGRSASALAQRRRPPVATRGPQRRLAARPART